MEKTPFNLPHFNGNELFHIAQAQLSSRLAGDGPYTKKCQTWLQSTTSSPKALLTHSCTAALEIAAILLNIRPGDEIIMPSYTFVSTANAFVLRGGVPVFVDIRPDTINIDERLIADAITPRTKAIVPVHYAGVACDMDAIMEIANQHNLAVVEDAAQAVCATYKKRALGSIGHFGAYSFHETKVITCGEGGALLVNRPEFIQRAEIICEKGTDRSRFFRGEVDKYTWHDVGSSYFPSEVTASFLWAQLQASEAIISERRKLWENYHNSLQSLEADGFIRRPTVPEYCQHNGHIFYVLVKDLETRNNILAKLKNINVHATFHYIPLHDSPGGKKFGRPHGKLSVTDDIADRLIRLPLWIGLSPKKQSEIVEILHDVGRR